MFHRREKHLLPYDFIHHTVLSCDMCHCSLDVLTYLLQFVAHSSNILMFHFLAFMRSKRAPRERCQSLPTI